MTTSLTVRKMNKRLMKPSSTSTNSKNLVKIDPVVSEMGEIDGGQ